MDIKRTAIICFLLLIPLLVFGQVLDKPAATVNLHKPEIITTKQLDQRMAQLAMYVQQPLTKKQVLDDIISEVLLKQAADYAGINVSDTEVVLAIKQQLGPQAANVTDDQLRNLVTQQTGVPWNLYVKQAKEQLSINNYIKLKKSKEFDSIKPPSDKDVRSTYDENSHMFINPEMVRFSQIFRDTRNLSPTDKRQARDLMLEVYRDLQNGVSTFEKLVVKYSDDTKSRYQGGDAGFLQRSDTTSQSLLGKDFFDEVFSLKLGQTSKVVESNIGYHIILVTEKHPKKFLELDDPISPATKETVRDRIVSLKMLEKQQILLQKAVEDLVTELKKDAEIVVYEKNIN